MHTFLLIAIQVQICRQSLAILLLIRIKRIVRRRLEIIFNLQPGLLLACLCNYHIFETFAGEIFSNAIFALITISFLVKIN